jgi:hypothetical protein
MFLSPFYQLGEIRENLRLEESYVFTCEMTVDIIRRDAAFIAWITTVDTYWFDGDVGKTVNTLSTNYHMVE